LGREYQPAGLGTGAEAQIDIDHRISNASDAVKLHWDAACMRWRQGSTVAVQRRNLTVDKVPVNLACELRQLVPHVDDLIQPRAEQITRSSRLVLLRP
jgi:hypothetical protein